MKNSAVTRIQTRPQIFLYVDRIIESYLNNDLLMHIVEKVRRGKELTETERAFRSQMIRRVFRTAGRAFYQYHMATYEEGDFAGERNTFATTLSSPVHRSWWEGHRSEFYQYFQNEVDRLRER